MKRGYYGIGIYQGKTIENLGTLWRSAYLMGASFIFTIGRRYQRQSSDTVKAYRHIPLFSYEDYEQFKINRPYDCVLIGIEQSEKSRLINEFHHPERCIYLLGAEDSGLPKTVQSECQSILHIDSSRCLNVAVAGSIVMFHRNVMNTKKIIAGGT